MRSTKACSQCGERKSLDAFARAGGAKDGHRSNCRECVAKSNRRYRAANRDREIERHRHYRAVNRDREIERDRRYRQRPERKAASRARCASRRARVENADGETREQVAYLAGQTFCDACGQETADIHVDHIHPLSKGGAHHWNVLWGLCPECNLSKSARPLHEWAAERGLGEYGDGFTANRELAVASDWQGEPWAERWEALTDVHA